VLKILEDKMNPWNSRTYTEEVDLQKMVSLLKIARSAAQISGYPGIIDLHEMMNMPAMQALTRLWENHQGDCLAYAIADLWDNLWFDILPEFLNTPLETEVIQWGEECLQCQASQESDDEALTLDTNCYSDDLERIALLKRHGFVEKHLKTIQMLHRLQDPLPAPQLPAGFAIRCVQGEAEVEVLAELHRAAFETEDMTAEYRLSMMQVLGYDPELDLLAVAPSGKPVAFCVCLIDPESGGKQGSADPIGTHPHYWKNGLARALLLEGLHRMRNRGVEEVRFSTGSDNLAMQKTAASTGFIVEKTKLWFSKPIKLKTRPTNLYNPSVS
jgi:mycothiol synthase